MKIQPIEYKCLVLLDQVEKISEGGIYLPDSTTNLEQMAQLRGKLVAKGGNAFDEMKAPLPEVGQMVMIAKYAGLIHREGNDEYRLVNDKDIVAIYEE